MKRIGFRTLVITMLPVVGSVLMGCTSSEEDTIDKAVEKTLTVVAKIEGTLTAVPLQKSLTPTAGNTPAAPTIAILHKTVIANSEISTRQGPSTLFDVVGTIPQGATAIVTGCNRDEGWLQLQSGEWIPESAAPGFSCLELPDVMGRRIPTDTPQPKLTSVKTGKIVRQGVNVRAGPGTKYDKVSPIKRRETVQISGRNSQNTWLRACCHEVYDGWVNRKFV